MAKPITSDEREAMAVFFDKKAAAATQIFAGCTGMQSAYPRLQDNTNFINLRNAALDVQEDAKALADYIRVASDEQWQLAAQISEVRDA